MAKSLTIDRIYKDFGEQTILDDIQFSAAPGEFIVLVGPSGCGKSTLLRIIAGLESASDGSIRIGERLVAGLAPRERNVAMVFQDYALYPHRTVFDNMAFSLLIRGEDKKVIESKVRQAAARLDLEPYLHRKPAALSGGQRQRVAIGRAIVREPDLFLFDEPLSNLDAKLRASMRVTIGKLHRELGTTTVYVTHDQIEAMTLADKIIVLNEGKIQQCGAPLDLFHHPTNLFVAKFIGSPQMNLMDGELRQQDDALCFVREDGFKVRLPDEQKSRLGGAKSSGRVSLGIRPDDLSLLPGDDRKRFCDSAEVLLTEPLGSQSTVHCFVNEQEFQVNLPGSTNPTRGDRLKLYWQTDHLYLFDRETERNLLQ